jgi:hypothetical protein
MATGDARSGSRYARAELGSALRYNPSNHGTPAGRVTEDERLLALCRSLLEQAS